MFGANMKWRLILAIACLGNAAADVSLFPKQSPDVLHQRDGFYVGGRYAPLNNDNPSAGSILVNQTYCERLSPPNVDLRFRPIVFIHGGVTSIAVYEHMNAFLEMDAEYCLRHF